MNEGKADKSRNFAIVLLNTEIGRSTKRENIDMHIVKVCIKDQHVIMQYVIKPSYNLSDKAIIIH